MYAPPELRALVAIASFGTANDRFLQRLIREYRAMPFDIDIVVLSNLDKAVGTGVEVVVGLPTRNPWSLPFAHKKIFVDRVKKYDLFIYSEDDTLITEGTLRQFLEVTSVLNDDEIAGFLRFEEGRDGSLSYPDVHGHFHWDPASLRTRGRYTLAHFTNEHSACYVLTQDQLKRAIASGGFLVPPHEWKYDLLCTAATDPYTQCGFTKLVPISHIDQFAVHHLPNKYVGRLGIDRQAFDRQISALKKIAAQKCGSSSLVETETKLKHGAYSKNYYEPVNETILSLIPRAARNVLSIGCASGEMECAMLNRGLRVVAIPLDSIISGDASAKGVEMVSSDFAKAHEALQSERFDCILYSNILHFVRDPAVVLSLFADLLSDDATVIIQLVNMLYYKDLWQTLRPGSGIQIRPDYDRTGVHLSSSNSVRRWCRRSRLRVEATELISSKIETMLRLLPKSAEMFFASELVVVAKKAVAPPRSGGLSIPFDHAQVAI